MAATLVPERALARTYDGGAYSDPWETVEEYRDVMQYASKHPNKGSQAVATATNTPRSRIRTWVDDGGAPDCVRGINTAREHDWVELSFDTEPFPALNTLVANVFSGGSIATQNYQPSFALNRRGEASRVCDALERADVGFQIVDDRDGRADEARPTTDGSVLGRVLAVLGAPVGPKAEQRLSLPDYLDAAPADVRESFVCAYLENRAHEHNSILMFREERSRRYLESLAELIETVADGPVAVSERNIQISKQATENLNALD